METWRDVKGYIGYYQVSDRGRIRSLDRVIKQKQARYKNTRLLMRRGKLLKPGKGKNGYYFVVLCKRGKTKQIDVHRLVAIAFIPKTRGGLKRNIVNHVNANTLNNTATNLAWCTIAENVRHAHNIGNVAPRKKPRRLTPNEAATIKSLLLSGRSNSFIANIYGISPTTVTAIRQGRIWAHT